MARSTTKKAAAATSSGKPKPESKSKPKPRSEPKPASKTAVKSATEAHDNLAAYRAKRDFTATKEPSAGGDAGGSVFVIQHHWATRDHYDFRLELDGVMKSWAVTKGPSTDPADKRLAVRTEDHPISYNTFEGTIPKGQYGGGTVMLWDRGTWEPLTDNPQAEFAKGKIAFNMHGERMKGRWALVRMKPRSAADAKRENWLLIKERDEYVRPLGDFLSAATTSITTGRTREEIETGNSAVWNSNRSGGDAQGKAAIEAPAPAKPKRGGEPPAFVPPMLCSVLQQPPEGDLWRYEIKYDGYRLQACVNGATVRLYTREGLDWTKRFPTIAKALAALDLPRCALDGEAVIFNEGGISDFAKLVGSLENDKAGIDFVAFDCLSVGKKDLRARPLSERRLALEQVLAGADGFRVRVAPAMEGDGAAVFKAAVEGGAEGIIAKRITSTYQSRRTPEWAKIKGDVRTDVVVVGYMPSQKRPFSSLVVAVERDDGLHFVGGVGTGYSQEELTRTRKRLDALTVKAPAAMKNREVAAKKIVWVKPELMAEVQYTGFTGDGQLRHARFLGWKEDRKDAAPPKPAKTTAKPAKAPARAKKTAPAKAATPEPASSAGASAEPVRLSNPQRLLIPKAKITKQILADYLATVSERMMPHLKERPVSFLRAPDGIEGERFFQRHALPGMKRGIGKVPDPGRGHGDYLQVLSPEGLQTCAQFSVIELHGWGVRLPDLDRPDRVVFDLDPDDAVSFSEVRRTAIEIRDLLASIELQSWPLLSGGKGIHVIAPLDMSADWDAVGDFAEGVAKGMSRAAPERLVGVMSKEKRKGKIFIDYVRNRQTSSAIVPWSPRARDAGTAAVPVTWKELDRVKSADQFTLAAAAKRDDPWAKDFFATKQNIPKGVLAQLKKMF